MNKGILEMLKKKCERFQVQLLRDKDFDEKSAWMFVFSFINTLLSDEIEHNNDCGFIL